MANQNAPYGFRFIGTIDGESSNFGIYSGLIASTNTNKIFTGDVLKPPVAGYYDVQTATGGGETIGGVALGFNWSSKQAGGKRIFMPYWPGNGDANGPVSVKLVLHRDALFQAQCLLGPVTYASVGYGANFNAGSGGNTYSGISSFSLDDSTLSSTPGNLPFVVYGVPGSSFGGTNIPPGDPTSAYNTVTVRLNNLVIA